MIDPMEVALDVAGCLCEALAEDVEENGTTPVCFCGVVPGDSWYDMAGVGDCDEACGQAWVRISSIYPTEIVGSPNVTTQNCEKPLGFDIEVGIVRCMPLADNGEAVSDEEVLAMALQSNADAMLAYRAIACCSLLNPKDFIITPWQPVGPEGGLVGGFWSVSALVV